MRNLQGDIIAVANADGEVVIEYTYDPWGKIDYHFTSNDAEENEALQMLVGIFCPLTYRGYNYDFTTGLYYLQSRYYNPEWGRFLNVDDTSILLATQGETHNANLFAYCNNNPVNRVDYTGRKSKLSPEDLLYIFIAWAGLQLLTDFGVTECFDEEFYHYVYAIDEYGLIHAQFAFKGNRKYSERYVIYKVVWGYTASWYTMAMSDKYKRLTKEASKTLWDALENTSEHIESMPKYDEDKDARLAQLIDWRNTGLGIILHSGELLNAYNSLEYQYPYLNLLKSHKNCSGIAVLLKPFFTSFPNVKISMRVKKTSLPEYDSIQKSMGV